MDIRDHIREIREIMSHNEMKEKLKESLYCKCPNSPIRSDGNVPFCEECGKEIKVKLTSLDAPGTDLGVFGNKQ